MKKILLFTAALLCLTSAGQELTANFGAQESMITYYSQGWDSQEDFNTWVYTSTNAQKTWVLSEKPFTYGSEPFSTVDQTSKSSLCLPHGNNQNETATSPAIEIKPNSTLEFYSYANAGFLIYGSWTLNIVEGNTTTKLLNQFDWAQEHAYDGQRWVKYSIDLKPYAGKTVKFSFNYQGDNGEDDAIDGFKIKQNDTSPNATITINEGEQVHFTDQSTGNITAWDWTFNGGDPETSQEQNPVVQYNVAGEYDVTLSVTDGTASNASTRKGYVIVKAQAPIARIGMPEEAYQSPFVAAFVPLNVPVTFHDQSTGNPTSWAWTFQGCTPLQSNEQNPTVTYTTLGRYSLALRASNAVGHSDDAMLYAIQAGGAQYIWNIAPEENSNLTAIEMGWYGNYAGSNWLGITEFAEHYNKPLAPATIDSVAVYFAKTTSLTPDATVQLSVMDVDANGMPGQVLATASLKNSELKSNPDSIVETIFHLNTPITTSNEFFIKIGNFYLPKDGDDIAIFVAHRNADEKSTTYQYVLDEDGNNGYLTTGKWFKNVDDPVSMAIAPILRYKELPSGSTPIKAEIKLMQQSGNSIELLQNVSSISIYNLNGQLVMQEAVPQATTVDVNALARGIYMVKAIAGNQVQTIKFVKN